MSKHGARASLLSGTSTLDRSDSPSPYPPSYRARGYSGDSYMGDTYPPLGPQHTTAGGYHEREGYAVGTAATSAKQSSWTYWPSSKWQWLFILTVFVQAAVGLALECYIFAAFQGSLDDDEAPGTRSQRTTVPTYLSLFIFGFVYQLVLVYDALRMKNTIQIIGLCIYNVGLLVEAAVQSDQIHDAVYHLQSAVTNPRFWQETRPLIIAVPCVIALGTACMCLVTWKLYHEFAWSIYKDISADLRLKRRFLSYQIYIALLKFDFFFFLAFTVQFLVVVVDTTDTEFRLTVIAIPLTIVLLFLAAFWARHETVLGMICIFIVYLGALAYFFFKLVRMYFGPEDRVDDYRPARRSLTTFAVITVLLVLVTIVYCVICTFNFKKGLKQHVTGKSMHQRGASLEMNKLYTQGDSQMGGGPGPSRIVID